MRYYLYGVVFVLVVLALAFLFFMQAGVTHG